jgi:UDP-glucose 4-epimerase
LADRFIADGHSVAIIDNLSSGLQEYIPSDADFRLIDIKDESAAIPAILGIKPDIIIHNAAQINVRASLDDPITDARENIIGGLVVLKGAIEAGVKRFIFASTGGAVYGDLPLDAMPVSEDVPPNPLSPYAAAKLAMEHYIRVLCGLSGIPWVILRYSNVYGPRQVIKGESGVVAIFTQCFISGRKPVIFGDGMHSRDYVYVKDVVAANVAALNRGDNTIINIGTGIRADVNEIYEKLKRLTGSNLDAIHGDEIPGEVAHIALDISLAADVLGWKPAYNLDKGLPETIEYYKSVNAS